MGCGSSRLSPEELSLTKDCILTGFEQHPVSTVVSAIRSHSTAGLLIRSQLQAVQTLLKLNSVDAEREKLEQFYARLTYFESGLKARVLAVAPEIPTEAIGNGPLHRQDWLLAAAVLLSTGSALSKAAALYFAFDEGFLNAMPSRTAEELVALLLRIAVQDLPLLCRSAETEEVQKYLARLRRNVKRAVPALLALVMQGAPTLTMEEFAVRLTSFKPSDLTTPTGLRAFAAAQTVSKLRSEEVSKSKESNSAK